MRKTSNKQSIECPFAITIDSNEQLPYRFKDIKSDHDTKYLPIDVKTIRKKLKTADYGIDDESIVIERKTKSDLYGSIARRENFEDRLQRMMEFSWSAVVVEAEWNELVNDPPPFTKFLPKAVARTIFYWAQRFPLVHWFCLPGRRAAEIVTFRLFECWWKDRHK